MLASYLADGLWPTLVALFVIAFLAATLLPLGSEVVVLGVVTQYPDAAFWAWGVATLGNTCGGLTNWWLGRYCLRFQERRWFPVSPSRLRQVQRLLVRFGQPALLFSWLPIIGDGLCLAAGVARLRLLNCVGWVMVGKGLRYAVVILGTNRWLLS